jgi:hypothetical protein
MKKNTLPNLIIIESLLTAIPDLTDEQLGKLVRGLNHWRLDEPFNFDDDAFLKGLWFGVRKSYNEIHINYENKVEANRENGRKGGRPKKTNNNPNGFLETHNIPNNPSGFLQTHDNPQNHKEKEKEKEKEKDKEKERQRQGENENQPTLQSIIKNLVQPTDEDIELFSIMFVNFNEHESDFDALLDMWLKLPLNEQNDCINFHLNYLEYYKQKKKTPKLFFYLKEKKYLWASLRK